LALPFPPQGTSESADDIAIHVLSLRGCTHFKPGLQESDAATNVIRCEQKLLHLEVVDQFRVMLPRSDIGIAQQRMPHQPQAERQKQFSAKAGRKFGVDDDETAARTKLFPHPAQHSQMMRHRVVEKLNSTPSRGSGAT
jgi:hypothetical protein